jgi:outer membrane protein assembly factor BamA
VNSRAAEVEAARDRKTQTLQPDTLSDAERALVYIRDNKILERITAGVAGFRLKLGGMVSGSGFALGPEYLRRDLADARITFRGAAQSSFKAYQKYELQFSVPASRRHRYSFDVYSAHRNYPGLNYYGPGPDSSKSGRSNFRLENTSFHGVAAIRPASTLSLGSSLSYYLVNVGPGADDRFASTDQVFAPAQAAGIDAQTNFFRHGYFAQYDSRDIPGGPRSGSKLMAEYSLYLDRVAGAFSFQRLDLQAQHYRPFFNQRRVFALRAKSTLTFSDAGQRVPFYMQPTLGGSEDLRGFRPFRFYDDNMLALNAEYRWETFSGLDMAVFADAGKVFSKHSQWNFHDLESSLGFGLRFNVRNSVFLRLDTGFSHEGFQFWIKFSDIFSEGPLGSPATQAIF